MRNINKSGEKSNKSSYKNKPFKGLFSKNPKDRSKAFKIFIKSLKVSTIVFLLLCIIGVGAALGIVKAYVDTSPQLDLNKIKNQNETSQIFDKDGTLVAKRSGVENRVWVKLEDIPLALQNAVLAVEDAQFWSHKGINLKRIFGAAIANLKAGDSTGQGASTITQQLIKNTILSPEQTFKRKIQEAYLAIKLELRYDKEEILEAYLNTIHLGGNSYGVKTAADQYFDKELDELTIRECAMLAGIIRSPYYYRAFPDDDEIPEDSEPPYEPRGPSNKQTELVLGIMRDRKIITKAEYDEAIEDTIHLAQKPDPYKADHMPYYIDYVIKELRDNLIKKYGWENDEDRNTKAYNIINSGGLKIYTTLDQEIQKSVENSLATFKGYPSNKNYTEGKTTGFPQPQAAAVVIDYSTGEIRGLVGARVGDIELRERSLFNNASDLRRDVGSTIKPIGAYGPALELGGTAADVYEDIPAPIGGAGYNHPRGYPLNYDSSFKGLVTSRESMRRSINVVTARVLSEFVGINKSVEILEKLGLDVGTNKHFQPVPAALAMGQGGASPLQIAAAFGTIANEGIYIQPTTIVKVIDRDGNVIMENKNPVRREVFKKTTSYILLDMMKDVVRNGTGTGAQLSNMPVAGKTGTTSDFTDAWFTGYTPYYVASVWIGNDRILNDGIEVGYVGGRRANGGNSAAPLWRHIMEPIHRNLEKKDFFEMPASIVKAQICTISGKLPTELCYRDHRDVVKSELFAKGTVPSQACDYHVEVEICALSGQKVSEFCPSNQIIKKSYVRRPLTSPYHQLSSEERAKVNDSKYEMPFDLYNSENLCTLHSSDWPSVIEQMNSLLKNSRDLITGVNDKTSFYKQNHSGLITDEDINSLINSSKELQDALNEYAVAWDNTNKIISDDLNPNNDNANKPSNADVRKVIDEHKPKVQSKYNNLQTLSTNIFTRIDREINIDTSNGESSNRNNNNGNSRNRR